MRRFWLLSAIWCAQAVAGDIDVQAQRQRIAQERARVEQAYRDEEARCARRFSVTACIDEARRRQRAQLERLEHDRALLDDMDRKRRAADRAQRIEEKRRAAETREPMPVHVVPRAPRDGGSEPETAPSLVKPQANGVQTRPRAEEGYEKRLRDAREHRKEVERRNAERAARRLPAAPLAPPSGAAR